MTGGAGVVVVGAGLAAAKAAEALRDVGFDGPVTILGAEVHRPYERPPLSKANLRGDVPDDTLYVHPEGWYAAHDVDLRLGTVVESVDVPAHRARTAGGEQVPFDTLLLATGSRPRRLTVPGADLDGVLYLRTLDDSRRLRAHLSPGARIVIVGGGWIGLETAAAARTAGADVTVLEHGPLPLGAVLGSAVAPVFSSLHRDHGVDLRTSVTVARLRGGSDGQVVAVELDDGTALPADVVLVGVGALPDAGLAERAGLPVDNGVTVDQHLRTSHPDVYAAGDVASAYHPVLRRHLRVEHWANALNQPAVAADAMTGGRRVYDRLPYFYSDQYDLGMEYLGHVAPGEDDALVVRGDLRAREFVAFWLREGRVLAGMNVNVWDVVDDVRKLILSGARVDAPRLANCDVPLGELVASTG